MIVKAKGTVLQLEIATIFTAIGQLIGVSMGKQEAETEEADDISDATADIEMEHTGRASQDDSSFELFYDPDSAAHQFITDSIADPDGFPVNGKVILASTDEITFVAAGLGFGLKIAKADFCKADCTIKHGGLIVYPT